MEELFDQNQMLTVKDEAIILKHSTSTIYRKVSKGELPCVRPWGDSGPVRFNPFALEEWLEKCSRKVEPVDRTKLDQILFPNRSGKDGVERINKLAARLIGNIGD